MSNCIVCGERYADDSGTTVAQVSNLWTRFDSSHDDDYVCTPCARENGEA